MTVIFFFSSRRRHTRWPRDWSSDVCSSDLEETVSFIYTVTLEDIQDGGVWNIATVTGDDPSGDPVEDDSEDPEPLDPSDPNYEPDCPDCTFTELDQDPSVELLKSGVYVDANEDGTVNPGDEIEYTFTVTNSGNVPLTDVVINDARIGAEDLFVADEMIPGAEETVVFTYTITQEDINDGGVWNIATVTGDDPSGDPVEDDSEDPEPLDPSDPNYDPDCPDCTFTELDQDPSIELLKSGVYVDANGDDIVNVGDEIHYTFTVTNTGNVTLTDVVIDDDRLGVSDLFVSSSIDPDISVAVVYEYAITQADIDDGGVWNMATVTGDDPNGDPVKDDSEDPQPLDPSDPDYDPYCPDCTFLKLKRDPSIELLKSGTYVDANEDGVVNPGDEIAYSFTVTNTGNVTVSDIMVSDPMMPVEGGPIVLAPGQSDGTTFTAVYVVTQEDIDAGGVWNLALAEGEGPEGEPVEDDSEDPEPLDPSDPNYDPDCPDCTFTELDQNPSIELLKSGAYVDANGDGMVNPGDEIEYSFTVINTGNVTVTNITVSDPMMPVEGGPIDLEVGESDETTFTGVYVITQEDIDAGGVWNLALAEGEDPNGDPVEDDSEDPEPLDPSDPNYDPDCPDCTFTELDQDPSIELLKSGVYVDANGDDIVNVGDEIHYTFTVTNTGNVTLTDVVIDDDRLGVSDLFVSSSIDPDISVAVVYEYAITQADIDDGGVWNMATVTGDEPNGDPAKDEAEDRQPLDPSDPHCDPSCPGCTYLKLKRDASIELLKSGTYVDANEDGVVNPGDEIAYSFTVTNTGNVTVSDIMVSDPMMPVEGGPIVLAPGQSDGTTFTAVYVVTQEDIDAGGVWNLALAEGEDPEGEPVEDDSEDPEPLDPSDPNYDPDCPDCTFTELDQNPSIELLKSGAYVDANGDGMVNPGDEIEYSFTVINTGNVTVTNITVSDPMMPVEGGPIDLEVGESDETTFTGVYVITQEDIDAGGVWNLALAEGEDPNGDPVEDDSEDPEPLDPSDPNYDPDCPDCTFTELDQDPSIELLKSGVYVDATDDSITNPD